MLGKVRILLYGPPHLVLKGHRLVTPKELPVEVLKAIHTGHQGETNCVLLARETVFRPGMTNDIKRIVKRQ